MKDNAQRLGVQKCEGTVGSSVLLIETFAYDSFVFLALLHQKNSVYRSLFVAHFGKCCKSMMLSVAIL